MKRPELKVIRWDGVTGNVKFFDITNGIVLIKRARMVGNEWAIEYQDSLYFLTRG